MILRTDLALDIKDTKSDFIDGIEYHKDIKDNCIITRINITNQNGSKELQKPIGRYITIELPSLTDNFVDTDNILYNISSEIKSILPDNENKNNMALVVGLGNEEITPDALGVRCMDFILATRHLSKELSKSIGLDKLRPVAVFSTSVLGKTGIESGEIILSIIKKINPSYLIVVDALATRKLSRLGCTVQISDSGISPGAGVGNNRFKINKDNMGIPVISIGIPTVVDANTLICDLLNMDISNIISKKSEIISKNMIVTPKEIDLLIQRASKLIGMAINCALQTEYSLDLLKSLMA